MPASEGFAVVFEFVAAACFFFGARFIFCYGVQWNSNEV
jgi:hypothetical protein